MASPNGDIGGANKAPGERLDTPLSRAHATLLTIIDDNDPEGRGVRGLELEQSSGPWYVALERTDDDIDNPDQGIRLTFYEDEEDLDEGGTTEAYIVHPDRVEDAYDELSTGQIDALLEEMWPLLSRQAGKPLERVRDRREATKRCVGPLVSALTFERVDRTKTSPNDIRALRNRLEQHSLAGPWFHERRAFATIFEAVSGLDLILGAGDESSLTPANTPLMRLSREQERIFSDYTNGQTAQESFRVAYGAQAAITSRILMPSYLAARYQCRTTDQLLATLNSVSLDEILATMRDQAREMSLMAFAPNGTFANAEPGEEGQPEDFDLDLYSPNSILVWPIQDHITRRVAETPPHHQHPHHFSAFDFYILGENGVRVNPAYFESAQIGVKLDSKYRTNTEDLTPTSGCPAAKRSFKAQAGDFPPEQLAAFEASPHIAVHLGRTGVTLDLEASAIDYLHQAQIKRLDALLAAT